MKFKILAAIASLVAAGQSDDFFSEDFDAFDFMPSATASYPADHFNLKNWKL